MPYEPLYGTPSKTPVPYTPCAFTKDYLCAVQALSSLSCAAEALSEDEVAKGTCRACSVIPTKPLGLGLRVYGCRASRSKASEFGILSSLEQDFGRDPAPARCKVRYLCNALIPRLSVDGFLSETQRMFEQESKATASNSSFSLASCILNQRLEGLI